MMSEWNAAQYLKFKQERTWPAWDLAGHVDLAGVDRALDVGCGPGNSTQVVQSLFPHARVTGVDSSAAMIQAARREHPGLDFQQCDIRTELDSLPRDYGLIFSNACLQWVPDHPKLLPELMGHLLPGGVLAVQVPVNEKEPIHQIIQRTAALPAWRERVPYGGRFHTLSTEEYFDLLADISQDFTMWETTYLHRLHGHQAIMDWYSSTGLKPYLDAAVDGQARQGFYDEVFRQVKEAYPLQKNGEVIFRFPRLFFIAYAL